MVLEKIPTFSEVQTWANNNLVSSVNGNTGDVTVGGMWTEIPESPYDFNDIEQLTINLSETYDQVRIVFLDIAIPFESYGNNKLQMRINGDGSYNYNYITSGGTQKTDDLWVLDYRSSGIANGHGYVTISGKWTENASINGNISLGSVINELQYGMNNNVSSPLQKIEMQREFRSEAPNFKFSGKIKVYGRNI